MAEPAHDGHPVPYTEPPPPRQWGPGMTSEAAQLEQRLARLEQLAGLVAAMVPQLGTPRTLRGRLAQRFVRWLVK